MKETLIPIAGKIYKVKLSSGRTWLFKSAYYGGHTRRITEHQGAYCVDCDGNDLFRDYVASHRGCSVGDNHDIISLKPANLNEIAIFKRKVGC